MILLSCNGKARLTLFTLLLLKLSVLLLAPAGLLLLVHTRRYDGSFSRSFGTCSRL